MQVSNQNEAQQSQSPRKIYYRIVFSYFAREEWTINPQKIELKVEVFSNSDAAKLAVRAEREIPGRSAESWLCKTTPEAIESKISGCVERLAYDHSTLDGKEAIVTVVEKNLWTGGENPRIDSSPRGFIQAAYADVQALTDDGDQFHRRAVVGKPFYVHLHGWDRWANEVPAAGIGMSELRGGRTVTLRVQGQYMDRGIRYTAKTTAEAADFAEEVSSLLERMPVPVPDAAEHVQITQ